MTAVYESQETQRSPMDLSLSAAESEMLARLRAATARLAAGGCILLCDDAVRPTRGEITFAAALATTESVAFAIRYSSGFLQVALPNARCDELGLVYQQGADRKGLQQCVTVDANRGISTGISAADRATTARLLASTDAIVESFTRPGHIVPIRAHLDQDVDEYGFAEAAVSVALRARLAPAVVLATTVGDNCIGMPHTADLARFAHEHDLPCLGLADLNIAQKPRFTLDLDIQLPFGRGQLMAFDDKGTEWLCAAVGDVRGREDVPLRFTEPHKIVLEATTHSGTPMILLSTTTNSYSGITTRDLHDSSVSLSHSAVRATLRHLGARSLDISDSRAP